MVTHKNGKGTPLFPNSTALVEYQTYQKSCKKMMKAVKHAARIN